MNSRILWATWGVSGALTLGLIGFGIYWARDHSTISRPAVFLGSLPPAIFMVTHLVIMGRALAQPILPKASWLRRIGTWYGRFVWVSAALAVAVIFGFVWWHLVLGLTLRFEGHRPTSAVRGFVMTSTYRSIRS